MTKNEIIWKAENLQYTYEDGTQALKGVNLAINKGEKLVLLGANGSGKSTFFLCMNGILKPEAGTVFFQNKKMDYSRKGLLAVRSKIGIVFQEPDNQLFASNVFQEISFGLLNIGVTGDKAKSKINKVMEELKISGFAEKPVHALSGGQKKQVAIADILVMEPDIIILDEPAAALDPHHVELVNSMIDSLTEKGITVIIASHDVDFAYRWAERVVLFCEGKVLADGSPEYIFSQRAVLSKTHLNQPAVLVMFESLCKKGMLNPALPLPKTMTQLEGYIEQVQNQTYMGGKKRMEQPKKAILVVSFGTTYHDTREKTIEVIEKQIAKAYPAYQIYRAWTSKMIIRKLKQRDNIHVDTVQEAMERMIADGVDELIIQPTHMINGIENDFMKEDVLSYQESFTAIRIGSPLLTTDEDNRLVIRALMDEFPQLTKEDALVFMGHGTTHYSNAVYAALDYTFKEMGYENVFVGTVEAYPAMETLLRLVGEYQPHKIILAPLMIVAGDHAKNDMASDDEESWRCRFEKAGYEVECVVKGLGEYEGIRTIFMKHLSEVIE